MTRRRLIPCILATTIILIALTPLAPPAAACPFCYAIPGAKTAQRLLRDSPFVALARPKADAAGTVTHFVVIESIHGEVAPGTRVEATEPVDLGESRDYLIHGKKADLSGGTVRALRKDHVSFLRGVASLPARSAEKPAERIARLSYFLDHLGRRDRFIAASVSEEFAAADYATMKAMRIRLDLEKLSRCIEEPERFHLHRGVAYLLVGVIGNGAAAKKLSRWLTNEDLRGRPGFDGLLGAWLLVRGEPGMSSLRALRPPQDAPRARRRWFVNSAVRALEFHAHYETRIDKKALFDEAQRYLDDTECAAPVVEMFRKLGAADRREAVKKALEQAPEEHEEFRRAARRFLD